MKKGRILLIICICLTVFKANSQEVLDRGGMEKIWYEDSLLNFKVTVPSWLNLKNTGSRLAWGGTLPAVEGIENAILIKAFLKEQFANLDSFSRYIVGDWSFGKHPKWSSDHACYGKKDLGKFRGSGVQYIVYYFWNNKIYHCKYALLETKTAFLWIDFTSTSETYKVNIEKFDSFLNDIELTNF